MATRSMIALKHGDYYLTIYCHWDGDSLLTTLRTFYNSHEAARALINLGFLSQIDAKTGATMAFHRDRGDPWEEVKPFVFSWHDLKEAIKNCDGEYVYVFSQGRWNKYIVEENGNLSHCEIYQYI